MPATPVKIGPFAGGLNTYSGPTSVGDNEAVVLTNFETDLDGSLLSRPPITVKENLGLLPAATGDVRLLGWFIDVNGDRYLMITIGDTTHARNEETGAWITVTATFGATAFVQYANKAYLIAAPTEADPGGAWTPGGGFVADTDIPKGTTACVYKERLFVGGGTTNPNRVYMSNAADFGVFQTTVNFFDVRAGDGQNVTMLYTFQDTVIIFKNDSTFVYSYDSQPSRGTVRLINGAVGITNRWCLREYENSLYLLYEDNLYQISNWNFTAVNLKVPFNYTIKFSVPLYGDTNFPTISIIADRLIVHFYDAIYAFNLRAGTWSTWDIGEPVNFNYFIEVPTRDQSEAERYYAGARRQTPNTANHAIFEWRPTYAPDRTEPFDVTLVTKTYDFNVPYSFKRLFWWGVDALLKSDTAFTVTPVAYSPGVTHAQLAAYTHAQLSTGTHLRPLDISIQVESSVPIDNGSNDRMFIRLIKSLRFRQIYFIITATVDGSSTTGPVRIYSLSAFVDNKQVVSKELS